MFRRWAAKRDQRERAVLQALLVRVDGEVDAGDIARLTGLLAGTTFPILYRFDAAGWVTCRREPTSPADVDSPRRRYYSLTPRGVDYARTRLGHGES